MRRRRHEQGADAPNPPVTGVAPLAVGPPRRVAYARRYLTAAVISGTLAATPLTHPAASARQRQQDPATVLEASLAPEERTVPPAAARRQRAAEDRDARASTQIADAAGVPLTVPSPATVLVGFHESMNPGALALTPSGPVAANHGAKAVPEPDEVRSRQVAPTVVLPTRGRAGAATSAIDIAIPDGERVLSPVTGEVVAVSPYFLYGQHPDVRIDVVPEGRPDLRVVVIHVSGVGVEVGDDLVAGQTPIARTATRFPFASQIDRFAVEHYGEATPHVHIEVSQR